MPYLTAHDRGKLHNLLSQCRVFESTVQVRALFQCRELHTLLGELPDSASSLTDRVAQIIGFLDGGRTILSPDQCFRRDALVVMIETLATNFNTSDGRYDQLRRWRRELLKVRPDMQLQPVPKASSPASGTATPLGPTTSLLPPDLYAPEEVGQALIMRFQHLREQTDWYLFWPNDLLVQDKVERCIVQLSQAISEVQLACKDMQHISLERAKRRVAEQHDQLAIACAMSADMRNQLHGSIVPAKRVPKQQRAVYEALIDALTN